MDFANRPLSDLVIDIPMASEIFRKNRLDFCCGGKQSLKEACDARNVNLNVIVKELETLIANSAVNDMKDRPLNEITAYIMERYHQDLRRRIPELVALADKVEKVHSDSPDCPRGLTQLLSVVNEELLMHMMKEENVLFPLIDSGRGSMALMPVKVMMMEHESHGRQIEDLRRLTNDFLPPEGACGTWRALYKGLEKFEEELMNHIHLENHILFPRALA